MDIAIKLLKEVEIYTEPMHPYFAHELVRERHADLVRRTELHLLVHPDVSPAPAARRRLAWWLRGLADRIDGSPAEVAVPAPTS